MTAWHAWYVSVSQNQHEQWLTNKLRYIYLHESSKMFRVSWDRLTAVCALKKKDCSHWFWSLRLGAGFLVSGWVEMHREGPCSVPMDAVRSTVWSVFPAWGSFLKQGRFGEQRLFFYLIWGKGLVHHQSGTSGKASRAAWLAGVRAPVTPSCDPRCARMRRDGEGGLRLGGRARRLSLRKARLTIFIFLLNLEISARAGVLAGLSECPCGNH